MSLIGGSAFFIHHLKPPFTIRLPIFFFSYLCYYCSLFLGGRPDTFLFWIVWIFFHLIILTPPPPSPPLPDLPDTITSSTDARFGLIPSLALSAILPGHVIAASVCCLVLAPFTSPSQEGPLER